MCVVALFQGFFANICQHISILVKMGLQQQTLHKGQQAVMYISWMYLTNM